jgi:hypothetical protein
LETCSEPLRAVFVQEIKWECVLLTENLKKIREHLCK